MCYAADLAAGGERLLNILVSVGILALCVPWIIIYPIIGGFIFLFISLLYLHIYISIYVFTGNVHIDNYPLNTIKGKICSQTFIKEFEDRTNNIDYSVKPKSILLTFGESSARRKFRTIISN